MMRFAGSGGKVAVLRLGIKFGPMAAPPVGPQGLSCGLRLGAAGFPFFRALDATRPFSSLPPPPVQPGVRASSAAHPRNPALPLIFAQPLSSLRQRPHPVKLVSRRSFAQSSLVPSSASSAASAAPHVMRRTPTPRLSFQFRLACFLSCALITHRFMFVSTAFALIFVGPSQGPHVARSLKPALPPRTKLSETCRNSGTKRPSKTCRFAGSRWIVSKNPADPPPPNHHKIGFRYRARPSHSARDEYNPLA